MDNYDDIKHLTRPQYDDLHPMSMHDRAAQFSPFAALVGYDDAVAETARLTDSSGVHLLVEPNDLFLVGHSITVSHEFCNCSAASRQRPELPDRANPYLCRAHG